MNTQIPPNALAIVVGASGGIGAAICDALASMGGYEQIWGTTRAGPYPLELTDENSIAKMADRAKSSGLQVRLVFDATGYLHGDHGGPEKTWSALDPQAMHHQFKVNAIGPALLIKHFIPLFPREGRSVFASISAKVGSISDNHLGGWYGYRASKAALNQIIRTASIELARKRPEALCLALHPGTVATPLSDPFAKNSVRLQTPEQSAASMLKVINTATPDQSGDLLAYDGTIISP